MSLYTAYLPDGAPSNVATSHPGFGETKEEALADALYWANQTPWLRTVALSRAPAWVRAYYDEATQLELIVGCCICGERAPTPIQRRYAMFWRCPRHADGDDA
jgi:hypothetical protein